MALLGGTAMAWPLAAHAQQPERMRRIGVLMLYPENDPAGQLRATAFRQGLEKFGWTIGRNLQIDYLWGVGDADWIQSVAVQLLRRAPDVILANGDLAAWWAQQATRTVPVIFIVSTDPVATGLVESLARPGGNLTGFTVLEPSMGPKMLELLKEIAPRISRVAVMFNPDAPGNWQLFHATAAAKIAVEAIPTPVRKLAEIEAVMTRLGREPNHGLIVLPDPSINSHRKMIVELAARYQLPAMHALRAATSDGGLMSYGVDLPDLFRQATAYADRMLKGEKPTDLPVQQPTEFEFVINLKTAKALGLTVPMIMQMTADAVIE
jgi:putative tryptophan/tyrosine transport system substrate-binding protein